MTATITQDFPVASGWFWAYESDLPSPTFYIYLDGELAEVTTRPYKEVRLSNGETIQFEVLDSSATTPQTGYPNKAVLTWYAVTGAVRYRIDEYVAGVWTAVDTVVPGANVTYFSKTTRVLEDQTTHRFRVVPLTADGIEGTPKEYEIPMVRVPDFPNTVAAYAAGVLTVSAA